MGYTTEFDGQFTLNKPLAPEHAAYLRKFARTRRMHRDPRLTSRRPDSLRAAVGLPVGNQGAYFVGAEGDFGQEFDAVDVVDSNSAPMGQPGLWCQWIPTEDGTGIEWDGGEKFYRYREWLEYLIGHFLAPWGYTLSGEVHYQGEGDGDRGTIRVVDGRVIG